LDEAIAHTNASPYGLLSAIFTRDLFAALRFAERVHSGTVNINTTTNHWQSHLPFGGGAGTASCCLSSILPAGPRVRPG
jgi:succinate-semialdehyde dehydrogenase/glutarate-semialdehyde dehydrogenase